MTNSIKAFSSAILIGIGLSACSLDSLVDVDKRPEGSDVEHDFLDTREGSIGLLRSALGSLQEAISETSMNVGLFTDELTTRPEGTTDYSSVSSPNLQSSIKDSRLDLDMFPYGTGIQFAPYGAFHAARVKSGYARHFLNRQPENTVDYAISASYSIEGYSILMLAENICSGIPLTHTPYGGTAEYGKALTTDSLFKVAISKFDSALAISHDSIRFSVLAKIGKGRALMSLGRYEEAALAVSSVEQGQFFPLSFTDAIAPGQTQATHRFWTYTTGGALLQRHIGYETINQEGENGLIWFSDPNNLDPRLPVSVELRNGNIEFTAVVRQRKFPSGTITFKLADWIESKLIEAEYLLSKNDNNWIDPVNAARQSVGLSGLTSPASKNDKVDLLFKERAYWFFLHGTRLSDYRRLVRQYGRDIDTVYPVGEYNRSFQYYTYGDAVVFVPALGEFTQNFAYEGCLNKNP